MQTFLHELRYPIRQLIKSPGFSLTVISILALGIGATTAIFSLVEGILLRPLPFTNPDRLVMLGDHVGPSTGIGVTAREIGTYAGATTAFSSVGGYTGLRCELSRGATPETVDAARLTASVFPTLGVQPILGRIFTAQEENAHQPVAVIGYSLWLNRFHRDPHILGTSITLNRETYSIIGVMPHGFEFPLQSGQLNRTELWIPMGLTAEELSLGNTGNWGYQMVARLKDGVTLQQGAEDANRVAQQIMRTFPVAGMAAIHIRGDILLLREHVVADARPLLRVLSLSVLIVLLIAGANVAGLLLVRSIRRSREYAVRLALGARSSMIVRESILEGLLLSLSGGLVGLGLAASAIRIALHVLPESMPRINAISIDTTVAAFSLLLSLASGTVCSLAPAFAALRTNLIQSLKEGVRTCTGTASHTWLRSVLVVAEIAIALVLLNLCGAFLRSFEKMRGVDPGFRPDHALVASYQLPINQYATNASADRFSRAVLERLHGKPGVVSSGITNSLPATGFTGMAAYTIEGQREEGWKLKFAAFSTTSGDYFKAMGIPVLDGRTFTENDRANMPLVVIVDQTMARDCWPGERAVGKRMHLGNPRKPLPWATVVGVVADTKGGSPDQPGGEQWYVPAEQPAILYGLDSTGVLTGSAGGYIVLRSALAPEQMMQTLRSTVAEVDPLLALQHVETMKDVVANIEAPRRFNTALITGFALAALLLAMTGIYAVVAFSVSLRTQEIAIRMALGAQRGGIVRLVLLWGAKLALLGCGLGVVGSLTLSRFVDSFLFGVSATDPMIYIAGVLVMMLMALMASALPAGRAASADPIDALRST
jgi:putative ABC transport system permease protein